MTFSVGRHSPCARLAGRCGRSMAQVIRTLSLCDRTLGPLTIPSRGVFPFHHAIPLRDRTLEPPTIPSRGKNDICRLSTLAIMAQVRFFGRYLRHCIAVEGRFAAQVPQLFSDLRQELPAKTMREGVPLSSRRGEAEIAGKNRLRRRWKGHSVVFAEGGRRRDPPPKNKRKANRAPVPACGGRRGGGAGRRQPQRSRGR